MQSQYTRWICVTTVVLAAGVTGGAAPQAALPTLSGVWQLHETRGELPAQAGRALDGTAEGGAGVTIQVDQTTAGVTVRRLGHAPAVLRVMPLGAGATDHQVPGGGLLKGRAEWRDRALVANGHVAVKQGLLKRNVPFEETWRLDDGERTLTVTTILTTPMGVKRRTQVFIRSAEAPPQAGQP